MNGQSVVAEISQDQDEDEDKWWLAVVGSCKGDCTVEAKEENKKTID